MVNLKVTYQEAALIKMARALILMGTSFKDACTMSATLLDPESKIVESMITKRGTVTAVKGKKLKNPLYFEYSYPEHSNKNAIRRSRERAIREIIRKRNQ